MPNPNYAKPPFLSSAERIRLEIYKLSNGNPGAISVMSLGVTTYGREFLHRLHVHDLQGPRIWELFKDVCKQDIAAMMTALEGETITWAQADKEEQVNER